MNGPGTPGLGPAGHRLRLSGTGDAPRARGWLHLGASIVALPAAVALVWRDGPGQGVAIYALALVGLFAVSASYHLFPWAAAARRRMRVIDHQMIFVFIAAATTPYCLLAVPGELADVVLALAWAGAAASAVIVAVHFEASRRATSTAYIVLGWLAVLTLPDAAQRLSTGQLALMASMALLYTGGAGVLVAKWPDPAPEVFGYHEVWHTMVVVATACSFMLIWSFAVPGPGHSRLFFF